MKLLKFLAFRGILFSLVLLLTTTSICGQKSAADANLQAAEKHYQYLENDVKTYRETMQKENDAFRAFIQGERAEHQKFLERTVTYGGIIVALALGLMTFFEWRTFREINQSRKKIEAMATGQLLEYSKALSAAQTRLNSAHQDLINYYRDSNPKNGRYLFIGSEEKIAEMRKNELSRFLQVFGTTEELELQEVANGKLYPGSYDVIVYRSNVDEKGQDVVLERVVEELKHYPMIPLVVYAANRQEWLAGNTEQKFYEHKLVHLANNQISLIDNTASAYRVVKMLPKPSKII
jgi:hypothetical protein